MGVHRGIQTTHLPQTYARFLEGIKQRIRTAQIKAALAANSELILHYWELGREILDNQNRQGWGAKVIVKLASDLQRELPKLSGYSVRNLHYMRAFAEAWPDRQIVQQPVALIPWGHNCVLLDQVADAETRIFYIHKSIQNGWARSVLMHMIDTQLHMRQGKAPTNFTNTLPPSQSELAQEMLKDPYVFHPAPLSDNAKERHMEQALLARLRDFLVELGSGFAFVGNQVRLEVDGEEFFIDLLFYHVRLHCYIVVELKAVDFQPEFAGKMKFYQTAVDNHFRTQHDNPTIGLILCRGKNKTVVEYSLRDLKSPVGVAEYRLLPKNLKTALPEVKKLKRVVAEMKVPADKRPGWKSDESPPKVE